jgi:hypothetical protein
MRFARKIKKIEAQRLKVGTFVYHPMLGGKDGIIVEPDNPMSASNVKKVYVKTDCGRVYTFCPNSLTKITLDGSDLMVA